MQTNRSCLFCVLIAGCDWLSSLVDASELRAEQTARINRHIISQVSFFAATTNSDLKALNTACAHSSPLSDRQCLKSNGPHPRNVLRGRERARLIASTTAATAWTTKSLKAQAKEQHKHLLQQNELSSVSSTRCLTTFT